jgi:UDP-N-acetylglucosamine--N-acetylmuramyl-(pentapeptide) pyrophosphoryl-undecaprenol N-acetylglucosamine transferase
MTPRRTVHLVASPGGHLNLLERLSGVVPRELRRWVTAPGPRGEQLARDGEDVTVLPKYERHPRELWASIAAAVHLVRVDRPKIVVSTGAGSAALYCAVARAAGAKIVFAETMARVTGPSASGRVTARMAASTLVQWPEMATVYPRAHVCRPVLLEDVGAPLAPDVCGTLLVVGTHTAPFDRLVAMTAEAVRAGVLPGPVLAQVGPSQVPFPEAEVHEFLTPEAMADAIARAKVIVSHGGAGSLSAALRTGHRPIVLGRMREHGEHFDDHQQQLMSKLAGADLVVALKDRLEARHVTDALRPLPAPASSQLPSLVDELGRELDRLGLASL